MFYTELAKYTAALRSGTTKHDASFDDVKAALAQFPDLVVDVRTEVVRENVMLAELTFTNPHGSINLQYRYSSDYFLLLPCQVKHDGHVYSVRWWNDFTKFTYALTEHRQTVHDFMRAVTDGF